VWSANNATIPMDIHCRLPERGAGSRNQERWRVGYRARSTAR
jgi:hypothetical protein